MKEIVIFGDEITSREALYADLRKKCDFPPYVRDNLDSVYDYLSEIGAVITVQNAEKLTEQLGDYGESFMELVRDLREESEARNS